jgi:hypothetical protein
MAFMCKFYFPLSRCSFRKGEDKSRNQYGKYLLLHFICNDRINLKLCLVYDLRLHKLMFLACLDNTKNKLHNSKWISAYFDKHALQYHLKLIIMIKYDAMRSSVQFLSSIWRLLHPPHVYSMKHILSIICRSLVFLVIQVVEFSNEHQAIVVL